MQRVAGVRGRVSVVQLNCYGRTVGSAASLPSATERYRGISDLPFCRYVPQVLGRMHAKFERNREDGRKVGALVFLFIFGSGGS